MILNANLISRWEQCHRLPHLLTKVSPVHPLVRLELAKMLQVAVRQLQISRDSVAEMTRDEFLRRAAEPGFTYPNAADYYVLAHDYASWMEGAVHLIAEQLDTIGPMQPLAVCEIDKSRIQVDGWMDANGIVHIWRMVDKLPSEDSDDYSPHWPEMVAQACTRAACVVHLYRLPAVRLSRVSSPLCLAYEHPMTGQMRLARFNRAEGKNFNRDWKRKARWEYQGEVSWQDWRDGIERDQCIEQVARDYIIAELEPEEIKSIKHDLRAICDLLSGKQKLPRKRESCGRCEYLRYCHGRDRDRKDFVPLEAMYEMPHEETVAAVSG